MKSLLNLSLHLYDRYVVFMMTYGGTLLMANHLAPLAAYLVHLDTLRNPFLVKLNVAGRVSNVVLSRLVTGRPA